MSRAGSSSQQSESPPDLFRFLQPSIRFSSDDKRTLDERNIIVRILPAEGHELAAVAAAAIDVTPDALVASANNIARMKRSELVPEIARFSMPPRIEDLRDLTLDDVDVEEIVRCRPERCGLKLRPEEITRLQQAIPSEGPGAKSALERTFRQIVLERANSYLLHGDESGEPQFSTLLQHSPYIRWRMPQLATYLDRFPAVPPAHSESFLYWSKETYAWKPMVTVTHVTIVRTAGSRDEPEVVIASRDVFATRYTSGSFILTLLLRDPDSTQLYLVYINRTWVDGLRALWRPFVEHRIKSQATKVFAATRDRIERRASSTAPQ